MRIPVKPITDSGVKPITQSGQADHLSERNDAGVHHAELNGFAARFTMASDMLHELAAQDSDTSLARRRDPSRCAAYLTETLPPGPGDDV